jgi:high-affinity iron transporter
MISLRRLVLFTCFAIASLLAAAGHAADADTEDKTKQIWQVLDYLAVDYSGAVADGKVANQQEYAEMQEFAQVAERRIADLPDKADKAQLLQRAAGLKAAIDGKASPAEVADLAHSLAGALIAAYPVPMAPAKAPSVQRGAALYQEQCASCHGAQGRGDGPLAARLDPPPIAFSDRNRAKERNLFALHQTITRGMEGTSMPAFAGLSDEDRWALAFFVSTLAYGEQDRQAGAELWKSDRALHAAVPTLHALTQLSESAFAKTVPAPQAGPVLAYLRNHPEALNQSRGASLGLSATRLRESLAALEKGDNANASRLALSAYLDGFEPVEAALAVKNKVLLTEIEKAMGVYRGAISAGKLAEARALEGQLQARLTQAQDALNTAEEEPLGVFLGALTIVLREGIEALLVIVAMIAFLKKAERHDVLMTVHAGWITALLAGGLTWFAATYLVEVSGASRELTEGFSAIFAAVVLLSVGIWMHQKSVAGRWQAYIRDKLSAALNRQSAIMLFILAFVTVYREVFETVLFYAALWTEGTGVYLLAGLALGIAILGAIAWIMLRTSARLPIGRFFAVSSALVAVLAVVLIGKGVAALQEAGMLDVTPIAIPNVDLLGIYPSLQTVAAQVIVALIVVVSMLMNSRPPKSGMAAK